MRASLLVALISLACLSACVSASPSPSVSAAGSAEPIPPAACPSVNLRSPTGDVVQLTGRWRSPDGGTYYLRHSGSCVWFTGLSADTGVPGGEGTEDWTNSFFGHLASDFTLRGSWADLPWGNDEGVGVLGWRIDFADVGGQEAVTLQVVEVTGGFGADFLVVPDTTVDLQLRLQNAGGCLAAVSTEGDDYQLILLPAGWAVGEPTQLLGPSGERILVSETFEVSGEVARGTGACGPGLLVFADHIEPITTP